MKRCIICGTTPVEWNHCLIHSGTQINEIYSILPLCVYHHRGNNGTIWPEIKLKCELLAIERGLEHLEKNYPRFNWRQRLKYLTALYAKTEEAN